MKNYQPPRDQYYVDLEAQANDDALRRSSDPFDIEKLKLAELKRLANEACVCGMFDADEGTLFSVDPRDASLWIEAVIKADPTLTESIWFEIELDLNAWFEDNKTVRYATRVDVDEAFRERVALASVKAEAAASMEFERLGGYNAIADFRELINERTAVSPVNRN